MLKFNIPNHEKELVEAENLLKKVQTKVTNVTVALSEERRKYFLSLTTDILYLIGEHSQPIFDLREVIEKEYTTKYLKSPALGKKLYLEYYEGLHKPYDRLKNRAFKLIKLIDPTNEGIEEEIYT